MSWMEEKQSLFEALFLPHLEAAYNLARWLVRTDEDAEDIVQEAYLNALKGFNGFRGTNARGLVNDNCPEHCLQLGQKVFRSFEHSPIR